MSFSRRLKRLVWISFGALYSAGLSYWGTRLFLRRPGDFGLEAHPLERVFGPIHLGAALAFIFVLGIVWERHVRVVLGSDDSRASGWLFFTLLGSLAATGVTMLYGSEAIIQWAEQVHPWIGASLLPILFLHVWKRNVERHRETRRVRAPAKRKGARPTRR